MKTFVHSSLWSLVKLLKLFLSAKEKGKIKYEENIKKSDIL